ncbi:hypothetical protein [Paraglaciecola aestuariivivens]
MTKPMMDKELAKRVIYTARFYMSGDNCQPFRFRFNSTNQCFYIDYLAEEAKHTFVYDDYTIILTLGSLLEYLDQSLLNIGYTHQLEFDFAGFSPYQNQQAICTLKVSESTSSNDTSLFSQLTTRFTDRRPYLGPESINLSIDEFVQDLTHCGCQLHVDAAASTLSFFASCDSAIWYSKSLGTDIMDAVAFDTQSPKGLPWKNLGVKKADAWLIRGIQRYHWLFDLLKYCGARFMMQHTQKKLWFSSKSFLIFTYPSGSSQADKVLASKQLMHVLLRLSEQGYVFQPSTMSAEILNQSLKPLNIVNAAKMQPSKLEQEAQQQRQALGLGNQEVQWILRVGKVASSLPKDALTNRHSTENLLSFE